MFDEKEELKNLNAKLKDEIVILAKAIKGLEITISKTGSSKILGEFIEIPVAEEILLKDAFEIIKKYSI